MSRCSNSLRSPKSLSACVIQGRLRFYYNNVGQVSHLLAASWRLLHRTTKVSRTGSGRKCFYEFWTNSNFFFDKIISKTLQIFLICRILPNYYKIGHNGPISFDFFLKSFHFCGKNSIFGFHFLRKKIKEKLSKQRLKKLSKKLCIKLCKKL